MGILDQELQKYSTWLQELERKKKDLGDTSQEVKSCEKVFRISSRKQEQLFRVAIYLLLNIAENVEVEAKMQKKGIVSILCRCLDRQNFDLMILVISFLKKLSMFRENVAEMATHDIIEKLVDLLTFDDVDLVNVILRLLYNLTFNAEHRNKMMLHELPIILSPLLTNEYHRSIALRILYQLSVHDKNRPIFAKSGCLPILMRSILENNENQSELECLALIINLACEESSARLIGDPRGIRMLMKRAFEYRDTLILKLLRNLSEHAELKILFVDFSPELVQSCVSLFEQPISQLQEPLVKTNFNSSNNMQPIDLVKELTEKCNINFELSSSFGGFIDNDIDGDTNDEDFVLECIGLLANLSLEELDYVRILTDLKLLKWIKEMFTVNQHRLKDDMLLEIIRLIGTFCSDQSAAKEFIRTDIHTVLVSILNAHQEDDEIVCQILFVFYRMIYHPSIRMDLTYKTPEIPAYLIDLMHDKNPEIRRICDTALDLLALSDKSLATRIQTERFKWHNNQWLEMIESSTEERLASNFGMNLVDSDDDSENVFMASTLLRDAAASFASASARRAIGGTMDDDDDETCAFSQADAFHAGEDIDHAYTPRDIATNIYRDCLDDSATSLRDFRKF